MSVFSLVWVPGSSVSEVFGLPVSGAQCRFDPELHAGPAGVESPQDRAAREAVAVEVCESCPLLAGCRVDVLLHGPSFAVQGGWNAAQLADLSASDLNKVA